MLQDFAAAIKECVTDGENFADKMEEVAAALTGDVWSVIKVIVNEAVTIWQDRAEITDDCKTLVTHWRGHDYKSAGKAVGDIVGIIISGLELRAAQDNPQQEQAAFDAHR